MDNKTVPYSPESCWTLVSGHCSVSPSYAVFTKKASGLPLATKAFVGGHEVLMQPQSATRITVQVGGNTVNVANGDTYTHKAGKTVIFKLTNWSGTYILNSDSNFSLVYDGNFVQVLPMMGTIGQHCGACGNFDGNSKNDLTDKKGVIVQADQLARAWC